MTNHEIDVLPESSGGDVWYRAVCSCRRWRSALYGYPGKAEAAGRDHAKAKAGVR